VTALTGLAGAGKTDLLAALAAAGEQVLDLEALASHRGSAFGGIGLGPQPSHAEFARLVGERLAAADPRQPIWVEDEAAFIGSVGVPSALQRALAAAPAVELRRPVAARVDRLAATYGDADPDELVAALARARRRLGPPLAERAAELVRRGDVRGAIALVLPRYDAAYRHRLSRSARETTVVEAGEAPADRIAQHVLGCPNTGKR
jgi:tRNA 2-selenouridine synthase